MRSFLWIFVFVVVLPTVVLGVCYAFSRAPSLISAILWQGGILSAVAIVMGVMANSNSVVARADGGFDVKAFATYKLHATGDPRRPDRVVPDMRRLDKTDPVIRTNGISIPRYHAGWFRTRDGRRAFLAVTDSKAPVAVFDDVDGKGTVLVVSEALIDGKGSSRKSARS